MATAKKTKAPAKKGPAKAAKQPAKAAKAAVKKPAKTPAKAAAKKAAKKPAKKAPAKKAPAKKAPAKKVVKKAAKTPAKAAAKKPAAAPKKAAAPAKFVPAPRGRRPPVAKPASAPRPVKASKKPPPPPPPQRPPIKGVTKDGIAYTKDFDAKWLTAQRALLLLERASVLGQAVRLEEEANQIIEEQEMGDVQFDDEGGEGDTMVVERERDIALGAQARQTVADIEAALERLKTGAYGYSVESARPIPREAARSDSVGHSVGGREGGRDRSSVTDASEAATVADSTEGASADHSPAAPRNHLRLCIGLALVIIALDLATKHWALNALTDEPPQHVIWTLQWNLTFNSGMAFSQGKDMGPLIGVLVLLVAGFVVIAVRKQTNKIVVVAAGFVLGGALGNLVDRIFRDDGWLRGSVVDFIDFQWFPIFNVADMAVNVGGAIFVLWSLFSREPGEATP